MICFIGKPTVDQAGDGGRSGPRPCGGDEVALELTQVEIKPIGDGGFKQPAEALDRVEFRTVGRQR